MSARSSRSSTAGGAPPASAPPHPPTAASAYYAEPPIIRVEEEKMKIAEATLEDEIQAFKQDMQNRDPQRINRDLKARTYSVGFNEIFAEPDITLHSIDCVWMNSYKVFELTKLWWYRFLSIICGLPIAICMGLCFACFSFNIIWCFQPCVRAFRINMLFIKQLWAYTVHIFVRPLTLACGGFLSTIRVHHSNGEYKEESFIV